MSRFANPYVLDTVRKPQLFFGREKQLLTIYRNLEILNNMNVVGIRRAGMSSLLYCMQLPELMKRYSVYELFSSYVFCYFEPLSAYGAFKPNDILQRLLQKMRFASDGTLVCRNHKITSSYEFSDKLEELNEDGHKIVFLIDEFEQLARPETFDADFFAFLRYVASNLEVSFIIGTAYKSLEELTSTQKVPYSPFWNIFKPPIYLGLMTKEEATRVITGNDGETLVPTEYYVSILETAGLHPFYIQLLCSIIFDYIKLMSSEFTSENWSEVLKLFRIEAEKHFNHIWDNLDAMERLVLTAIATNTTTHSSNIQQLVEKGLVVLPDSRTNDDMELFSSMFTDFVLHLAKQDGKRQNRISTLPTGNNPPMGKIIKG